METDLFLSVMMLLGGATLAIVGAFMLSLPVGLIAIGLFLFALGVLGVRA